MPRQPRLILPDVPVHIVHRGNNRLQCFGHESDYLVYRALLVDGARRSQCVVHAYCLMGNHIHLLLTPPGPRECGTFMHAVAQRYAHYYNRKYKRTGTLWEGRFRSCIVGASEYLLACYRYIELNPVRAGIVSEPNAYRWSSYPANAGMHDDPLVTPHAEFSALGRAAYVQLVADGIDARSLGAIRDAMSNGYPLASETFKAAIAASTGKKTGPGRPGRPAKKKEAGNR